jgi:hypothetical protein
MLMLTELAKMMKLMKIKMMMMVVLLKTVMIVKNGITRCRRQC